MLWANCCNKNRNSRCKRPELLSSFPAKRPTALRFFFWQCLPLSQGPKSWLILSSNCPTRPRFIQLEERISLFALPLAQVRTRFSHFSRSLAQIELPFIQTEPQNDYQNEDTAPNPMLPPLQRDEKTGLWQWPILLNGDYSQWTNEPCAILFAQGYWGSAFSQILQDELLSGKWPRLIPFRVGNCDLLILCTLYSIEQALLLAEDLNRQASEIALPSGSILAQFEQRLTWGIALPSPPWNMPEAVAEAIAQEQKAWREERFGSINFSQRTHFDSPRDLALLLRQDGLTNLGLRPLVFSWAQYQGEPIAVLIGDIDNMKRLNDNFGLPAGEAALQVIAETLHPFQSTDAFLYRYGGDKFSFLLRDCSRQQAETMAREINTELVAREFKTDYNGPFPTPSLTWGGVVASLERAHFPQMTRRASDLVLAAKEERRGSVKIEMC